MSVNVTGGALEFEAIIDGQSKFQAQLNRMERDLKRHTDLANTYASSTENFARKAAQAAAGYLSVTAAAGFIKTMVQVRGEFQQIEVAYRTMLKSKEAGDKLFAETVKLAAQTPFTLQEVATGAKQLLAYGFAAQDVTKTLTTLGNVSAGVGAPLGDIVYLYGTLRTQGRAFTRDILQFTSRGIPIIAELAKQFGVEKEKIQGMVEAGKVGFPEIEKAFNSLTGSGGIFFNLMQQQSKTLTGLLSNLNDAWSRMLNDMGQANEGFLSSTILAATNLVNNYQKVLDIVQLLIIAYGAYRAALIITAVHTRLLQEAQLQAALSGRVFAGSLAFQNGALAVLNQGLVAVRTTLLSFATAANATVAIFAALAAIAYSFAKYQDASEIAQTAMNEALKDGANAARNEKERIDALISTIRDHTKTKEQQKQAYDELISTTGKALIHYSQEEIAAGKASATLDVYTRSVKNIVSAETQYASFKGIEDKLKTIKDKGIDAISMWDRLRQSIANTFAPTSQGVSFTNWVKGLFSGKAAEQQIVDQQIKKLKDAQGKILKGAFGPEVQKKIQDEINKKNAKQTGLEGSNYEKFNALFVDPKGVAANFDKLLKIAPDKAALDKLKDGVQGILEASSPTDPAIAKLKQKLQAVQKVLDKYSLSASGKEQSNINESIKDRANIIEKIANLNDKYITESKTEGEQKLDAIRAEFASLKKDIDEFNADPKRKAAKINADLAPELKSAEDNERAKQQVEKTKETVAAQKQIYDQYEQYKTEFGKDQADKRFEDELNGYSNFVDFIKAQLQSLDGKSDAGSNALKDFYTKELPKAQKEANGKAFDESVTNLKRIVDATITAKTEEKRINEQYDKDLATLRVHLSGDELAEREAGLAENHRKELLSVRDLVFQETQIYKDMQEEIFFMTMERLKEQVKKLKQELKDNNKLSDTDPGKLTPEQRSQIKNAIKQSDELYKGTNKTTELTADIAKYAEVAAISFHEIGNSLEGINDDLAYTLNNIGDILKVGSDAAGSFVAFASGDIVGGITKAISAITGLFSIGKKVKEMNAAARAEVSKFYDEAITGEIEYQALIRERARQQAAIHDSNIAGLLAEQALLKSQTKEIDKQYAAILAKLQNEQSITNTSSRHGTWTRRAKVTQDFASLAGLSFDDIEELNAQNKLTDAAKLLFEQLRKLKEEGADVTETLAQLAEQTKEIFTGTTADSITDSLLQMFREGRTGAQDLADFFEQTMQDAALSIFKNKVLAEAMSKFYEEFAKDAQSNGSLSADEIKRLQDYFNTLIGGVQSQFMDLKKITGMDFLSGGDRTNSLSGSIRKELSEETGTIVAGAMNALHLIGVQQLSVGSESLRVINNSLAVHQKIEQNTRETVAVLNRSIDILREQNASLSSIDRGVKDNTGIAARAAGKFGY